MDEPDPESSGFHGAIHAGGDHPPARGRYHLYASLACPLAHRTLIVRMLKGLHQCVGVSVVDPLPGADGWIFSDAPGCEPDFVNHACCLRELYEKARPGYSGPATVPMLWDSERHTIVNDHPADLLRLLNDAFDEHAVYPEVDLYPPDLRACIDSLNARLGREVDETIDAAGRAATLQSARGQALRCLYGTLDWLDDRLGRQRYLAGDALTEPDVRLFTTLVRFDAVYYERCGCTGRRIEDYRHLSGYLRDLYQTPGFGDTVNMAHIRQHFGASQATLSPGLLPAGPRLDFLRTHDRERLSAPPPRWQAR